MNIRITRINYLHSFYDINKLFNMYYLSLSLKFNVVGYENFFNGNIEIYKTLNIKHGNQHNYYEIFSVHFGLLNYHGYLPEELRSEIISHKSTKLLFEHMHSIFFMQYIKAIYSNCETKFWSKFISHTIYADDNEQQQVHNRIQSARHTVYLKHDAIALSISKLLNIDAINIKLFHNHIFKLVKTKLYTLGLFVLGRHTIGNHYYTTMCLCANVQISSCKYIAVINKLNSIMTQLNMLIPEFKLVFVFNILDNKNLDFRLGTNFLGYTTWVFYQKDKKMVCRNSIF